MRSNRKFGLVLFSGLLLALFACTSPSERSQLAGETTDYETEGWLNDDTFQVKAIGAPSAKAKGFVKRRTQSEEAALLSAQKRVVELLVGADVRGASGSQDGESTGVVVTKELEGFLKGGAIVRKSFDTNDNCEIVYRVHADGLKDQAESLAKKEDFRE